MNSLTMRTVFLCSPLGEILQLSLVLAETNQDSLIDPANQQWIESGVVYVCDGMNNRVQLF